MFYVCIVSEEKPHKVMYPEHYLTKQDRDTRARWLTAECYVHDGSSWKLYCGTEPFEAALARLEAPAIENETPEDRQIRLNGLALKAAKLSKSALTEPEIDDRPEEFRS